MNKLVKSVDYNTEYNSDVQKLFIEYVMSDTDAFALCRNILNEEYFDTKLASTVKFLLEYAEEQRGIPTFELVKAKTGVPVKKVQVDETQRRFFLGEIEKFCRYKAMQNAIMEAAKLLESGAGGEIERLVKNAMEISLQTDLGTDFFHDPKARLQYMMENSTFISTGWQVLDDKLGGGFAPGTLNIWCGGPGCVTAGTKVKIIKLMKI